MFVCRYKHNKHAIQRECFTVHNFLCQVKCSFLLLWFFSFFSVLAHCFSTSFRSQSPFSHSRPSHLLLPMICSCFSLQVLPLSFAVCNTPSINVFLFISGQIAVNYSNTSIPSLMLSYTVSYLHKTLLKQIMKQTTPLSGKSSPGIPHTDTQEQVHFYFAKVTWQ